MAQKSIDEALNKIVNIIKQLLDSDVFEWIDKANNPTKEEIHRAASVIADRLCGSIANPIIRNAQEQRQLAHIESWLNQRGYKKITDHSGFRSDTMPKGTFCFRMNVHVKLSEDSAEEVNIPVDALIMPKNANNDFPLLIEAKSAGDFTNTNKRRKEEAKKYSQLKLTYGKNVKFILFLCGYFNTPYLGYEAGEGIDWVWEHRMDDLEKFGV